jgi:hypothetical protein
MLVIALFLMRVRRMIRPLALFGVVVVVIALGLLHRRRRAKNTSSGSRPIEGVGTSTVGMVGTKPGTPRHLQGYAEA